MGVLLMIYFAVSKVTNVLVANVQKSKKDEIEVLIVCKSALFQVLQEAKQQINFL